MYDALQRIQPGTGPRTGFTFIWSGDIVVVETTLVRDFDRRVSFRVNCVHIIAKAPADDAL